MKDLVNRINGIFEIIDIHHQKPELTFVQVKKELAVPLITHLRDYEKYTHLVFFTAVDFIKDNEFQLIYMLHNYDTHTDLGVRVRISRENAEMTTIHHLWKQAATYERELKELFGIDFPGCPRVEENFVLEGWDNIPPMRKEFDTKKYSEETYFQRPGRKTWDPKAYMKEKLYPEGDK